MPLLPPGATYDHLHNNPAIAEAMLHEAIEKGHNTGGKQYYYPLRDEDDKLHVFGFQPTYNDGSEYHGYLYETRKFSSDLKDIAKNWREQGIISNKEFKAINKNNCPHWYPGQQPRIKK